MSAIMPLHLDLDPPGDVAMLPQPPGLTAKCNPPTLANTTATATSDEAAVLEWDWEIEHQDRKLEAKADAAGQYPLQVDRKVLKDVVRERMHADVGRIKFLSSGTFHKAYMVTLVDNFMLVARVARRFMPRLKTESEVATMAYLRENTSIPVPTVYYYDSNPYNRLGGEYILMSKAEGIPLSHVFHSMAHGELVKLLNHLSSLIIPLFSHRFSKIGSLYSGLPASSLPTPRPSYMQDDVEYPFNSVNVTTPKPPQLHHRRRQSTFAAAAQELHVGPIISWPFFGSNRGELSQIDRGPWGTTEDYLTSCAQREIDGVIRENEGSAAPHRLHLDPDEIQSSRHHHLKAVPGDESDESDEWDLEESEGEAEGPGDVMYRDYRRMQRSTFLIAHLAAREEAVKQEMERWKRVMTRLGEKIDREEFGIDCHDLSLENVFVDEDDHSKITCIIDWESTTTRPLWACAHLPSFLQSSPFIAGLFCNAVCNIANGKTKLNLRKSEECDIGAVAREWLFYEAKGTRLRMAHRFVEWDGWEEGLLDSVLGPVDQEEVWFEDYEDEESEGCDDGGDSERKSDRLKDLVNGNGGGGNDDGDERGILPPAPLKQRPWLPFATEKEKTKMLDTTGDICGGRGGELGRRLEAWLHVSDGDVVSRGDGVGQDGDVDAIDSPG